MSQNQRTREKLELGANLIPKRMPANHDRLRPARDGLRDALEDDGFAEDGAAEDVADLGA